MPPRPNELVLISIELSKRTVPVKFQIATPPPIYWINNNNIFIDNNPIYLNLFKYIHTVYIHEQRYIQSNIIEINLYSAKVGTWEGEVLWKRFDQKDV